MSSSPLRVAIAGGGFAAAEALIALRALASDRVTIDLVAPNAELALRPLAVAAPFGLDEQRGVALAELCAAHDATLHAGTVTFVDVAGSGWRPTGARPSTTTSRSWPPAAARARRSRARCCSTACAASSELRRLVADAAAEARAGTIAFAIPDGVTWSLPAYELALMTALRAAGRAHVVRRHAGDRAARALRPGGDRPACSSAWPSAASSSSPPARRSGSCRRACSPRRGVVPARHVVALPRVEGPRIPGVPCGPGTGSSASTSTGWSTGPRRSTRPATSPTSPSSRVAWPRSRPMPWPRRSPGVRARRSSPRRSRPSCVAMVLTGAVPAVRPRPERRRRGCVRAPALAPGRQGRRAAPRPLARPRRTDRRALSYRTR